MNNDDIVIKVVREETKEELRQIMILENLNSFDECINFLADKYHNKEM